MQVVDSGQHETSQPGFRPTAWARVRRILMLCIGLGILGTLLVAAGFAWFVGRLPDSEPVLDRNADAIVVLTGGSSRVVDGIELLAAGRGQRLLISGVHRATNRGEISRVAPEHEQVLRCCVDLDRSAMNTLGNAIGTRRWVSDRGFRSIIVVTSSYHMPRAVAELSHQMPEVTLIPFPVMSDRLRTEPWWSNASTAKLLFSEYLKYIFAVVRMRLYPVAGEHAAAGLFPTP
jgi:uncharacterized SAM-binding protein YcdF (DUF218 family)